MGFNNEKIFVEKLHNKVTDSLIYFSLFFLKKNFISNSSEIL